MRNVMRILGAALLLPFIASTCQATNLTGTFKHPDGSLVNGKLILRLSQAAKLSDNSAQIVPLVKIFSVTSGALEAGAFVYGNDVLLPTGTYYVARLVDSNNNLLFEQKWSITGTSLDLGTLTPTTTGVVLADPLIRNVVTSQVVQGPVTFSSPLTAFSLTLNGNLNPGTSSFYDMGNPTLPWRELYAERWNGAVVPVNTTASVTNPATGPTVATDATSGGSLDSTVRYIRVKLLTLNGSTKFSPVQTYTPSTCGGGACKLSVNLAGVEWYEGAIAFRVYACTDASGSTCYRQSGFPDEIDTSGPLANAHLSPGTVILSSVTLTGSPEADESSNTAAINTLNAALNSASLAAPSTQAVGTVQLKGNGGISAPAYTVTTPVLLARPGTRLRGHGSESVDITSHGSTIKCDFSSLPATTQKKLGCVMIMNVNGVDVEGVNVDATATNAVMLNTYGSSFNMIRWNRSAIKCTSSIATACIKIQGIWYYLEFNNNQIFANLSGSGANKGAAILYSNASGADHKFTGKSRWTVNNFADAIRNDLGKTDRDRGSSTTFPTMVGEVLLEDVTVQWSPQAGSPQGVLMKGGGLSFAMNRFKHSDYGAAAGTGPLIEFGFDADGAGASAFTYQIKNEPNYINATGNNASWAKNISSAGGGLLVLDNVGPQRDIDLNNLALQVVATNLPMSSFSCNANAGSKRFINAATTAQITCSYMNNPGVSVETLSNQVVTGGFTLHDPSNRANARYFWWPSAGNLGFYLADPSGGNANQLWESIQGKRTVFRTNAGTGLLLDIDARSGVDVVQLGGPLRPSATATYALGSSSLRWNGVFSATGDYSGQITSSVSTGTAPFSIASTTEVANLNTQKWHGKDALDFSAALDFASIAAQSCSELTISVTGAAADNPIAASWPAALEAGLAGMMYVSSANTVTVRLCNVTASAVDPASRTYAGRVIK